MQLTWSKTVKILACPGTTANKVILGQILSVHCYSRWCAGGRGGGKSQQSCDSQWRLFGRDVDMIKPRLWMKLLTQVEVSYSVNDRCRDKDQSWGLLVPMMEVVNAMVNNNKEGILLYLHNGVWYGKRLPRPRNLRVSRQQLMTAVLWESLGIWQLLFVTLQMDTFPDGILLIASLASTVSNAIHCQEKDSRNSVWVNWQARPNCMGCMTHDRVLTMRTVMSWKVTSFI